MAYNIGDEVTIKRNLDPGSVETDYQCHFIEPMLKKYGGATVTITNREKCPSDSKYKYPSDGFFYTIAGESLYKWTKGMFEPPEKKMAIKIKKQSIKLNYSL